MASDDVALKIVIGATDQTGAGVQSAEGNISKLQKATLGARVAFGALGGSAAAATGFLSEAAREGAEDEASTLRLQKALENTGASWAANQKAVEGRIDAGLKLAFSDDQIRDSLSLLLAQTGDLDEAFKRQKLAMDLSRGANIDLQTASKLLGKVTDENVNVLGRYGITVQKGASETELFAAIQQKFGGQAEVFGNSTSGSIQKVHNAIDDWRESVGQALGPWQGLIALAPAASVGYSAVASVVASLIPLVRSWTVAQTVLNFVLSANPIGIVIVAVAALAAGIFFAYQHSEQFRGAVHAAWRALQGFGGWIDAHLRPILNWLVDRLRDAAGAARAVGGLVGGLGSLGEKLHFEHGGIVPGPIGAPTLAVVHGGERITPAGGGGGSTYNINVSASPMASPADVGRAIVGAIQEYERRSSSAWRR